jgi:hypothetical protein
MERITRKGIYTNVKLAYFPGPNTIAERNTGQKFPCEGAA